jgi:hypothetical protein
MAQGGLTAIFRLVIRYGCSFMTIHPLNASSVIESILLDFADSLFVYQWDDDKTETSIISLLLGSEIR